MTQQLSFSYSGSSANSDTYTCSDENTYASVLWMDREVSFVDGVRHSRPLKVAVYTITVHRRGPVRWEDVARFKYTPSRNPAGMHLPDRTVTKLIRQELAEKPDPKCSACGGRTLWCLDHWICDDCGSEWHPDHGPQYAVPD